MVPSQQKGVSNKIEVIKWILDSSFPYDNEHDLWFIHLDLPVMQLGICTGKLWGTRGCTHTCTLAKTRTHSQTYTHTPRGFTHGC